MSGSKIRDKLVFLKLLEDEASKWKTKKGLDAFVSLYFVAEKWQDFSGWILCGILLWSKMIRLVLFAQFSFFCVLKQGGQGLLACRVKQILLAPLLFHFAFKKSLKTKAQSTVFENRQKSRIQHCERSELRLSGQKFIKNAKNCQFWRAFENMKLAVKQCYQTCQF